MIHETAKQLLAKDLLANTFIVEISYYDDGIGSSLSRGIYIFPAQDANNIVICKYQGIEYKTRCYEELLFTMDMLLPNIINECSKLLIPADQEEESTHLLLSSTQYIGIGLHKFNHKINATNVIAFFYHYFDSHFSKYDVLDACTWENNIELTKLKALGHSMLKLLVMHIRKLACQAT